MRARRRHFSKFLCSTLQDEFEDFFASQVRARGAVLAALRASDRNDARVCLVFSGRRVQIAAEAEGFKKKPSNADKYYTQKALLDEATTAVQRVVEASGAGVDNGDRRQRRDVAVACSNW